MAVVVPAGPVAALQAPVGLGTAASFSVLAGQGVTNTGPTTVSGDLGTSPNPAVTDAGLTVGGTIHRADAVAAQAQADTTTAYNTAAGRTPAATVATELGGQNLKAGVYNSATGTFGLTGTLTLDAEGDPNAVFIFQTASTLITASSSNVNIINAGTACNVFWQVGSSATLGTFSSFRGTVLALTAINVLTGVTVDGRLLARNAAVTLDTDTITQAACTTPMTSGTTLTSSPAPSAVGQPVTLTATVTAPTGTPTGAVTYFDNGTPLATTRLGSGGSASFTTTQLAAGSHSITAVYLGSSTVNGSTSPGIVQVVTQAVTTTTTSTSTTVGTQVTTTTAAQATTTTAAQATTTTAAPATTTTAASPTATGGGGSSTSTPTSSGLARTGADVARLVVGALLTLGLGALLLAAPRGQHRSARIRRWPS